MKAYQKRFLYRDQLYNTDLKILTEKITRGPAPVLSEVEENEKSFMRRHLNISFRTSEHVAAASACISEQDIRKWFDGIQHDETGFSLCPKTKAVLAPKVPTNWGIGLSDSDWMKPETFYEFITNICHPFLFENNIKLHVLHLTYQPTNITDFRSLKEGWKRAVFEGRLEQNCSMAAPITKVDFAQILQKIIEEIITPDIIKNEIRGCVLYLWNPNNINFDKCLGTNLVAAVDEHCLTENNLNFDQFCDIVGLAIVPKCITVNHFVEITPISKELQALLNVYNLLNEKSNNEGEMCIQHQDDIIIDSIILEDNFQDSNICCVDQNYIYVEQSTTAVITPENNNIDTSITTDKNVSPLDIYLIWPITPERKDNGLLKQFPDVLTPNANECSNEYSSSIIYKKYKTVFWIDEGSGESILFICNSCQKK
ncbi:Hypothetical protein CINCED_3A016478, partial [Cinara cedri]